MSRMNNKTVAERRAAVDRRIKRWQDFALTFIMVAVVLFLLGSVSYMDLQDQLELEQHIRATNEAAQKAEQEEHDKRFTTEVTRGQK